jgi:hypothetical protein
MFQLDRIHYFQIRIFIGQFAQFVVEFGASIDANLDSGLQDHLKLFKSPFGRFIVENRVFIDMKPRGDKGSVRIRPIFGAKHRFWG